MEITNNNALKILFISNGIFVFADRLLGPLYAIFANKFDSSVLSISFGWFILMSSATVFTFIVAKYGDSVKEKEYMLVAGFMLRVISWILYIFTINLTMFFLIQILLGIGEALGSPAFDSIFANHVDKGLEVSEYAHWKIICNFSLAIASLIGGFIVYYLSFDILFISMALLGTFAASIIMIQPRKLL